MKKLFFNKVTLIVLAAVTFFSSCKKDEGDDTTPGSENPTLGFLDNTGADKVIQKGETFTIKVNAASNATTKKNLKELTIKHGTNSQVDTVVSLSGENYTGEFTFKAAENPTTETWHVTVTDKAGKTAMAMFKVTTEGLPSDISIFEARLLGGKSNTDNGSFLEVPTGTVHKQKEADANQALIDIVYYWGATNEAALGAPDDADGVHKVATNVASWTAQNQTRFVMLTTTKDEFAMINYDKDIVALAFNATEKSVKNLAADMVFGFKTVGGKMGVAKVVSVVPNATGAITIDVKVQK